MLLSLIYILNPFFPITCEFSKTQFYFSYDVGATSQGDNVNYIFTAEKYDRNKQIEEMHGCSSSYCSETSLATCLSGSMWSDRRNRVLELEFHVLLHIFLLKLIISLYIIIIVIKLMMKTHSTFFVSIFYWLFIELVT